MSAPAVNPAYLRKGDLTQGAVGGHLLRLSVPMMWGIFAIISFQLVDTFYISFLGTVPLAAITFTFPITYVIFSAIMGLGIAMSSVVSRELGAGAHEGVRTIVAYGLALGLVTGMLLAAIGIITLDPLFHLLGADETMIPLIRDYMLIWFLGSVFFTVPMVGNAAIRACGNTFLPAMIMTVAALINVALDPILIFGLFGFPRLELQGAAIATLIANFCAMLAGLYVLHVRMKIIGWEKFCPAAFALVAKRLGTIALPAGLAGIIQPLSSAVIIALLAGAGTEAVAAYGVISRLEAFSFIVIMALATGMAPIVGQNWGARRFDRVDETLRKALIFAMLWSLLIAVFFLLCGRDLVAYFSPEKNPAMLETAGLYFAIVALTYPLGNLVQGWISAFNAMGLPRHAFMMIATRLLLIQTPLAFAGHHFFGVAGVFGAIAATNIVTGIGFHIASKRTCRRERQRHGATK